MKIIAIEGLDKSGKHTHTKLLTNYLRNKGYNVVQTQFPRYKTPTGRLIRAWLEKRYKVDQTTIELIMAADRQAQQYWFNYLEEQKQVDFLIIDRYTLSEKVYAICTGSDPDWIDSLQRYMRKPDINILINITPEESLARRGKFGFNDRYEEDLELLTRVHKLYNEEANIKVDGLQDREFVHNEIIKAIEPFINK